MLGLLAAGQSFGQSTTQDFPTAVVSNEIAGTINARDLGDSRLTTYYFTFNSDQGDLFINLVTKNLTGDIDVFTVNGLRPITKIVVYADYGEAETGRAVYFRKPEKLLLRIQGRSPNDDAAAFRLKFAGSFVAAKSDGVPAAPELPKVNAEIPSDLRVNSVGTILPAQTKPVEATPEKEKVEVESDMVASKPEPVEPARPPEEDEKSVPTEESKGKSSLELVITDPLKTEEKAETPAPKRSARTRRRPPARRSPPKKADEKPAVADVAAAETEPEKSAEPETPAFRTLTDKRGARPTKKTAEPKPDPLASINLVIQLKDGNSVEKKMSEVFKFSVDKGILTVILKNGSITKYQIVDVAKVTIE